MDKARIWVVYYASCGGDPGKVFQTGDLTFVRPLTEHDEMLQQAVAWANKMAAV